MAVKALLFGLDDKYDELKPFYDMQIQRGNLDIVGRAIIVDDTVTLAPVGKGNDPREFDIAIISSRQHFYERMKMVERLNVPREKIMDGFAFKIPNLNFPRLLNEGVAYGLFENQDSFSDITNVWYPRVYKISDTKVKVRLGAKSRIHLNACVESHGSNSITMKNFSRVSWNAIFELGLNFTHNNHGVAMVAMTHLDWEMPRDFFPPAGKCKIQIGNDVWIGRGCRLKCNNPEKPLVIGDGAVVAADSVVVKSVPPYAIVGGNPAQIIKYRFPDKIIEALLRIKWWDWSIDKLHDNFQYFNRVEEFVEMFDKRGG